MNTHAPQELVINSTQLEAQIKVETRWDKQRIESFRERLWVPVNLEKRFTDLSALYKKIHDLLTRWNGSGAYDVAEVTTHIVMELVQWTTHHRIVDSWSIWASQRFYVGNVWIWPELSDYTSLSASVIAPIPLPNPPKENLNVYRAMAGESSAHAIIHTESWRVLQLHPHDMVLKRDWKEVSGTPVSVIVAERMMKFVEKMNWIVRD